MSRLLLLEISLSAGLILACAGCETKVKAQNGGSGPVPTRVEPDMDPNNFKVETYVNGEVRQSSNTSQMIFSPAKLIAYISKMWTLEPGDIIWSGTPEGVILGYPKEKQVWLKAGDQVTSVVGNLGELKFKLA